MQLLWEWETCLCCGFRGTFHRTTQVGREMIQPSPYLAQEVSCQSFWWVGCFHFFLTVGVKHGKGLFDMQVKIPGTVILCMPIHHCMWKTDSIICLVPGLWYHQWYCVMCKIQILVIPRKAISQPVVFQTWNITKAGENRFTWLL